MPILLPTAAAFAFGLPQGGEWIVILVIALLLFGRRLPDIMRSLGGSVREFKKGMDIDAPVEPAPPSSPHVPGAVSRSDQPTESPKLPDR
jgi:sec-independent protein translocase protein TatA